jgi:DNA-binding transcriptional LysR family regulator
MGSAQKLGLSQPATSKALARLRTLFKDELLVKTSRGVVPTPKAVALVEPIRQALLHVQSAQANEQAFDPKTNDRVFRLRMDDLKSTSSSTNATFSFSRVKLAFPYKTTLGGTVRVRSL